MPPDHRLLVILPASSDALESPPPTEISMKPDNGKGRWRDDVDPGHSPSAHMGSCLAWKCRSNTPQAMGSADMLPTKQLSLVSKHGRGCEDDVGGENMTSWGVGVRAGKERRTSDYHRTPTCLNEPTLVNVGSGRTRLKVSDQHFA
jgi:hypothetical protein